MIPAIVGVHAGRQAGRHAGRFLLEPSPLCVCDASSSLCPSVTKPQVICVIRYPPLSEKSCSFCRVLSHARNLLTCLPASSCRSVAIHHMSWHRLWKSRQGRGWEGDVESDKKKDVTNVICLRGHGPIRSPTSS